MEASTPFDPSRWPRLVVDAYHAAGMVAYLNTFVAVVLAVGISLLWARAKNAGKLPLLALAIAGPLLLGGLGYLHGMQQTSQAIQSVDPSMKDRLFELGQAESLCNLYIGGALSALVAAVYGLHFAVAGESRG